MNSSRERLDPNNTLPFVELDIWNTEDFGAFTRDNIRIRKSGGLLIGETDLITTSQQMRIDGLQIYEPLRRKGLGYGLATCLAVIELAEHRQVPLESADDTQSPDARKIWLYLAKAGIAQEVEPFEPIRAHSGEATNYRGKYIVPVPLPMPE